MGCGASSSGSSKGVSRTERRAAKSAQREAVTAYVSTFLTQPIFHAQMQAVLSLTKNGDENADDLQALATVRSKLADYCNVFGGAERNAFNDKLRSSLSEAQCEAFVALRLDPKKLAGAVIDTLRDNPGFFPIHLDKCFSLLMERPCGLEDIQLPPRADDDSSDGPDTEELDAMDARLGAQLGNDIEDVRKEFPDALEKHKGKKARKVEISLGVVESFNDRASVAARGKQRQEAIAELKRLRQLQRKTRRGSLPEPGSPKWLPELQKHPLRATANQSQEASARQDDGSGTGTRRRVKKSEKRARQVAKRAARRPSAPAIVSPKWVTVDPNARLPAAFTAKGKAARAAKKKHRRRRHSAQERDKGRHGSRTGSFRDNGSVAVGDEDRSAPLIVRMPLPAHGKLQALERPGSAPMSPGVYEPPTPLVQLHGGTGDGQQGGDADQFGMSVDEFEQRMAEWLEYNRQERVSPGSGLRPLPLNASGKSKPHLVSPKTPVPLRASEVYSFKTR